MPPLGIRRLFRWTGEGLFGRGLLDHAWMIPAGSVWVLGRSLRGGEGVEVGKRGRCTQGASWRCREVEPVNNVTGCDWSSFFPRRCVGFLFLVYFILLIKMIGFIDSLSIRSHIEFGQELTDKFSQCYSMSTFGSISRGNIPTQRP